MVDSDDEYRQEMEEFVRKELAAIEAELMGNNEEMPTQPVPMLQMTKTEPETGPTKLNISYELPDSERQRIIQNIPAGCARTPQLAPPQLPFNTQSYPFPAGFGPTPRISPFVSPEISPVVSPSKSIAPTVTPSAPPVARPSTVVPAAPTVIPTAFTAPPVATVAASAPKPVAPFTVCPAAPTVPQPAAPQQMPLMKPNKSDETPLKLREEVHFEFVHVPLIPSRNPPANPAPPRQRSIPPPVTVSQAQPRPMRSNSDRIVLQHRPPPSRRTESPPPPPPVQTRQPAPVDFPLIESDTSIYRGTRGRNRPITPLFEPEPPAAHPLEQSTWVDETTLVDSEYQMNPNEAIARTSFLSDSSTDVIPDRMFPELARDFRTQQEIQEEEQRRMNAMRVQADIQRRESTEEENWERPTTAMSRRPPILPPPSKGRAANGMLNQTVVSNAAPHMGFERYQQNPHNLDDFSFDDPTEATSSNQISRRSQLVATTTESYNSQTDPNNFNPDSWTTEALEKMDEEQLKEIVNFFYESGPHLKFKESYPFLAEGMIQKDSQTNMLKVFSSRLGKILIQDTRLKKSEDYVYFVVVKAGDYRGFYYDTHPKCLISAKFPTVERIVLRGYAILAHPIGSRDDSLKECRWICWNDSLGLMSIITGAARTPLKKQPVWDKQLDIISIHANFENKRFVVTKVVGLTNTGEKQKQFPEEVFLIRDGVYRRTHEDDIVFYSRSIKAEIVIKKTLVGEVDIYGTNPLDIVVVPYFPRSTALEFRALLIIHMPDMFWSRDKEWIRELLADRTKAYIR